MKEGVEGNGEREYGIEREYMHEHFLGNELNAIMLFRRLSEKEAEYKEQSSVKLQEWSKSLTPLQEWFVKSEQKLESLENLESNMNNLKRQNQEYLVCPHN